MPWRRSMIVSFGLSVCAAGMNLVGCAVSPAAAPEIESPEAVTRTEEPVRLVTIVQSPANGPEVSTDDVIDWSLRGVTDDVIMNRIHQSRSVFHLSAAQQGRLRDAGVSDKIVRAMGATAWD